MRSIAPSTTFGRDKLAGTGDSVFLTPHMVHTTNGLDIRIAWHTIDHVLRVDAIAISTATTSEGYSNDLEA